MAIAQDYQALERLAPRAGNVLVLCTGYVYRWAAGRWLFVRVRK
jgi:hypothetical protein